MNLISLDLITSNPYQRRTEYGDIVELAEQIAAAFDQYPASRGVMQIPRGRQMPDGSIQLLYGHRRIEALRYLRANNPLYADGLAPVQITEASDEQMLDAVWAENAQRRQLSAIEEARLMADALDALSNGTRYTQSALARRWGIAQPTVANRLRLLQLPTAVQQANAAGVISERVALSLLEVQRFIDAGFVAPGEPTPQAVMDSAVEGKRTSEGLRQTLNYWRACAIPVSDEMMVREWNLAGIEQAACTGCRFLLDNRCIKRDCFNTKKSAKTEQEGDDLAFALGCEFLPELGEDDAVFFQRWANYGEAQTLADWLNKAKKPLGDGVVLTLATGVSGYVATWDDAGKRFVTSLPRFGIAAFMRGDLPIEPPKEVNEKPVKKHVPGDAKAQPLLARLDFYQRERKETEEDTLEMINASAYNRFGSLPDSALNALCRFFLLGVSSDSVLTLAFAYHPA